MKNKLKILARYFATMVLGISFSFIAHVSIVKMYNKNIDSEFQPYYDRFVKDAKRYGMDVSDMGVDIQFVEKGDTDRILGHCSVTMGSLPKIRIISSHWARMNLVQREMTIYHELGHCFLLKGHTEDKKDGRQVSLMNPTSFSYHEYSDNREEYLKEIFSYRPYHVKAYIVTFVEPTIALTLSDLKNFILNPANSANFIKSRISSAL